MNWNDLIEQRPDVMLGKPVIKGTRLTVELILERLGHGTPEDDLLASHPRLRTEHIRAALARLLDQVTAENIHREAKSGPSRGIETW